MCSRIIMPQLAAQINKQRRFLRAGRDVLYFHRRKRYVVLSHLIYSVADSTARSNKKQTSFLFQYGQCGEYNEVDVGNAVFTNIYIYILFSSVYWILVFLEHSDSWDLSKNITRDAHKKTEDMKRAAPPKIDAEIMDCKSFRRRFIPH